MNRLEYIGELLQRSCKELQKCHSHAYSMPKDIFFFSFASPLYKLFSFAYFCFQGVMEEAAPLTGDNAFNAHFGECISAIGDIDDDGYQGQCNVTLQT